MKIAICDDCPADRKKLKTLILESAEHPEEIYLDEFPDGKALLEQNQRYNIIFLDILISGEEEGVNTAAYIRKKDENALFVFYTAYDYPASCIVKVRPFQYLVKDKEPEELKASIEKVMAEAEKRNHVPCVLAVYKGKRYVLRPEDILYISILDKGTAVYLTEEKTSELIGSEGAPKEQKGFFVKSMRKLADHYMELEAYGFAYAKKSYIINMHYIVAKMKDEVWLKDGTILSIARSKKKEFESQCSRYWGRQGKQEWK